MSNNPYYDNFESGGYFCNALNRDITMVRGDTMSFGFEVQGLGGELPTAVIFTAKDGAESSSPLFTLDLTNTITIRDYDSETDVYTFALRLPPEKTYDLNLGRYFYDLEIQVNYDVFTILRGRLELVADITRGGTSPAPQYESGDDIYYPVDDIPLGSVKLYTEQTISNIAQGINDVLDDDTARLPVDCVTALAHIKSDVDDIEEAINIIKETAQDITLDEMAGEILEINPPFTPLKNSMTNLWITVDDDTLSVSINFKQTVANGCGINWGDGTGEESVTGSGSSMKTISHTYSEAGSYVIKIRTLDGSVSLGYSSSYHLISGAGRKYNTILQYAEIYHDLNSYAFGDNINLKKVAFEKANLTFGDYIFSRCSSLREIRFDEGSVVGAYFIYYTCQLDKITLKGSGTAYSSNGLGYSFGLREITLSPDINEIPSGFFRDNSSLESLTFPANITSINAGAFTNCNNLREFTMLGSTPPTLSGAISTWASKVYIPAGSLSAYQSAQYWSDLNLIEMS